MSFVGCGLWLIDSCVLCVVCRLLIVVYVCISLMQLLLFGDRCLLMLVAVVVVCCLLC